EETRATLRLQVVRVRRQGLGPVVGDEDEILEPAAAVAASVEPGLESDHVAVDEVAGIAAQPGLLVNLEADAVPEAVEEAVLEHLAVTLVQTGGIARLVEEFRDEHVDVTARDARLDGLAGALECLEDQRVVGDELLGRLAHREGSGHVRVARGLPVARPEVENDRLARLDLAGTHLVADRSLGAVGDDELLAEQVQVGEPLLDGHLDALAGQPLAVEDEHAVLLLRLPKQSARGIHARLGAALRATYPFDLRLAFDAPTLHERL